MSATSPITFLDGTGEEETNKNRHEGNKVTVNMNGGEKWQRGRYDNNEQTAIRMQQGLQRMQTYEGQVRSSQTNIIAQEVETLGRTIETTTGTLTDVARNMEYIHRSICKEKGRVITNVDIVFRDNNIPLLIKFYSDGSNSALEVTRNIVGMPNVFWYGFGEEIRRKGRNCCVVKFTGCSGGILFEPDKMSGRNIVNRLEEMGICFNLNIRKEHLQAAFQTALARAIRNPSSKLIIQHLPGWTEDLSKYYHASSCPTDYSMISDSIVELPVIDSIMEEDKAGIGDVQKYLKHIKRINDKKTAFMFLVVPFYALLLKVYDRQRLQLNAAICIITDDSINSVDIICKFLQTFNRYRNELISLEDTKANIEKSIAKTADQTVLFYGMADKSKTRYEENKINTNINKVCNYAAGKTLLDAPYRRRLLSLPIIITNNLPESHDSLTIYWDEDIRQFEIEGFSENLSRLFRSFVEWAESNMQFITEVIKRSKEQCKNRNAIFHSIAEILSAFLMSFSTEFTDVLKNIFPNSIHDFLEDVEYAYNDEITVFKKAIRKQVNEKNVVRADKITKNTDLHSVLIATDKGLCISPCMWKMILKLAKIQRVSSRILNDIDKKGYLISETGGYSHRMTFNGERTEFYVIDYNYFEEEEYLSLRDLIELEAK